MELKGKDGDIHTHIVRQHRNSPCTNPRSRDFAPNCASSRRSITYHGSQTVVLCWYLVVLCKELGVCVGVQSWVSVSVSVSVSISISILLIAIPERRCDWMPCNAVIDVEAKKRTHQLPTTNQSPHAHCSRPCGVDHVQCTIYLHLPHYCYSVWTLFLYSLSGVTNPWSNLKAVLRSLLYQR